MTGKQERYAPIIARALALHLAGKSLFAIAVELGVTKEWLRTYAGIA